MPEPVDHPPSPATRIVGIGASAGGLESLEQLFQNLPADTGMGFVVVQHLSPDFRSVMDELLARHSPMPIRVAEDGLLVGPNQIYLMPAGKQMIIRERRLVLTDKDPSQALSLPIDQFLRSLAQDLGSHAVAVILSGSGTDGSRGIVEIKRAGGTVLAESSASAKFDGMPLSAQETGAVDHSHSPRDLARVLIGLPPIESEIDDDALSGDPALDSLFHLLREQFGIDFSLYKTTTVARRIQRRLDMLRIDSISAYVDQLRIDADEVNSLYRDLLIGVTQFMRDPGAFETLEREVIPQIIDRVPPGEEIRVWVAGCGSGEEAYSIAMLFYEQLVARERPLDLKILATDVHPSSLETASTGIYGESQLANVDRRRLERFFTRRSSGYQISSDLRQLIVFARHNVTKDAPFTRMHLITCRNMLIYLQPPAQRTVISLFHFGLAPGGILFLGASETPGALADEFTPIDDHFKIYRKKRDVQLLSDVRLPLAGRTTRQSHDAARGSGADPLMLATYDQLLDRYMPPSFLVDEARMLIDSFGGAERLLKLKRRRPSHALPDLLDGDLRTVVSGAIARAFSEGKRISYDGVAIVDDDGERRCTVGAELLNHPRTGAKTVLITLTGLDAPAHPSAPRSDGQRAVDQVSAERMETLERELAIARESLQATIEELETSNEEMQATNEELVSSNEELQSTNEELHSVNEELYTVNAEYQQRINELKELNADIQHLLEGTDVGTVFLDRDLRIRRFTNRIASVFRFLSHDVGRQISDFSHNIDRPTLIAEIEQVRRDGLMIEDEVRDTAGQPYLLRILPYRISARDRDPRRVDEPSPIEGVVLTLTDITSLDRARSRLAQMSAIVQSSDDAIIGKALDGTITSWNRGAEKLYGYTAGEAIGRSVRMLVAPNSADEFSRFLEIIRRGDRVEHVRSMRLRKGGEPIEVSVTISPILDASGTLIGVSSIARDISPMVAVQRELEEREERIRLLLESTAEVIVGVDRNGRCTFCNPAFARMLGRATTDELAGESVHALIHPAGGDDHSEAECPILRACRDGIASHCDDERMSRPDGTVADVEYWTYPMRRHGEIVGAVMTLLDVSDRKAAESEIRLGAQRREQFLAMLSHELRNPLAAVLNAVKLMQHTADDQNTVGRCIEVVDRQSRHMARLLDDLLDVSRITRGKFELRKEDLDFRRAVEAAIESTMPRRADRQISLDVALPNGPVWVRGDLNRLQQVVVNLLANAATYSPMDSKIKLELGTIGDEVVLRVADQGFGIPPEMLDRIFELFVQGPQHLDRSLGGLGVGLSLARSIVDLHAGTIEAHSDGPGTGSEFVVRLPVLRRALSQRRPAAPVAGARCRIVLVEDQPDSREMLQILLQKRGHIVIDAADGEQAIDAIEREHPDVALVDIGLPNVSGYEVARAIRSREHLDDVLLVALTGYGAPNDVASAREAGFDEHVIKPVELQTIEQILARHKPV
jgi:two-component system, chemotaxis family, CheB/CheR fusion protein